MPAAINVQTVPTDIAPDEVFNDFLTAEAAARTVRDAAWALLNVNDPIGFMIPAWDVYVAAVEAAFDDFQEILIRDFNQHAETLQYGIKMLADILNSGDGGVSVAPVGGGPVASTGPLIVEQGLEFAALYDLGFDGHFVNSPAKEEINMFSDDTAMRMIIELDEEEANTAGNYGTGQQFLASQVKLAYSYAGRQGDSYAMGFKEITGKETDAFSLAGTGDSDRIKGGARARVFLTSGNGKAQLMAGNAIDIGDDLADDAITLGVTSDLWRLEGASFIGRFTWCPNADGGGDIVYDQAGKVIFNKDGLPDMIQTPEGPAFAPYPGYGLTVQVNAAASDSYGTTGQATVVSSGITAVYWGLQDIVEYARRFCYGAKHPAAAAFPQYNTVNSAYVVWPPGLGSGVVGDQPLAGDLSDQRAAQGFKNKERGFGSGMVVPHFDMDGWNMRAVLEAVARDAGAYALYLSPQGFKSVISFVPTKNYLLSGRVVNRVVGAKSAQNRAKLHTGTITRNYYNTYTSVFVNGDVCAIETLCSYDPEIGAVETLQPAWTPAEEEGWKNYIRTNWSIVGNDPTTGVVVQACQLYPRVFCAYRVNPSFDYLAGTPLANMPRVARSPFLFDHLLTWIQEFSPIGLESLKRRLHLPVRFEIRAADTPNDWLLLAEYDGLTFDEQGNFYVPALRDAAIAGQQDAGTFTGVIDGSNFADNCVARPIRATLGICCDFNLTAGMTMPGREVTSPSGGDSSIPFTIGDPSGERGLMATGVRRQYTAQVGEIFQRWERINAFPMPQTIQNGDGVIKKVLGAGGNDDRTLWNDSQYAMSLAVRRLNGVGRPQRSCRLQFNGFLVWQPGTAIGRMVSSNGQTKQIGVTVQQNVLDLMANTCAMDGS